MYAFLYDEGHPDMPGLFGPRCAELVIQVLEGQAASHILVGSLLHSSLAYGIAEVSHTTRKEGDPSWKGGSSQHKMEGNTDHFKAIICDLAETLGGASPSLTEDDLLSMLGRKNIWLVVATDITPDQARAVHENADQFGPYLGYVRVDAFNPLHRRLFVEYLFKGRYLSLDGMIFLDDESGIKHMASEYGAKKFQVLDYENYESQVPALSLPDDITERGALSASRAAGPEPTHRQRVANEISRRSSSSRDFLFSARAKDNVISEFVVPQPKLTEYLLNAAHPKGGSKARFFSDTLGITTEDWRYLADQLAQGARIADLYRVEVTDREYTHGAIVKVTGRNGREALIETGWKLQDDGPASFVTAYPYDGPKGADAHPVASRVPQLGLAGDEYLQAVFKIATSEGHRAGEAAVPPPMVLNGYGTIWDGECGFAWVHIPNARTPFGRWLSKQEIGYPGRPGRTIYSSMDTQSIAKHRAFARAFADTLLANGIECSVDSRLD